MELPLDTLDLTVLTFIVAAAIGYLIRYIAQRRAATAPGGSRGAVGNSAPTPAGGSSALGDDRDFVAKMRESEANLAVFYGSQTGTAEDFAERLAGEARRYGLKALVCDIQDYDMEHLTELSSLDKASAIFTVATYGEGEPTDNMQEFFDDLKRRREDDDPLEMGGAHFAVFGLGNKTYEHFNEMGKVVDSALDAFGGQRLVPLGMGDDDEDMEEDFANWKEDLWPALCQLHGRDTSASGMSFRLYDMHYLDDGAAKDKVFTGEQGILKSYERQRRPYTAKNPFLATVAVRRELYNDPDRNCLHIELDVEDSYLRYTTGDHVAIYAENNKELVEQLGRRLNLDLDRVFTMTATDSFAKKKHPFPCPCSFRTALTHYVDITSVISLNMVNELAQYAADDSEKEKLAHMASKAGREEYHKYIHRGLRSILHVLEDFPSLSVPVDHLLELLPHLQPRYYSISSSHSQHPKSIHVTAAVVKYETPAGKHVEGVATTWLHRLNMTEQKVPVFVRHSQFRLPANSKVPIIMIGPGTGIAPFRGFIQERAEQKAKGKEVGESVLFFGCQKQDQHFMYRNELEKFEADGVLSHLFTAFSRDQTTKVYVQHRLLEQKKLVWDLLDKGANIYVCGDAKHMARDVHEALISIVTEVGGKTKQAADDYLKTLSTKRRFQQDVWS